MELPQMLLFRHETTWILPINNEFILIQVANWNNYIYICVYICLSAKGSCEMFV